MEVKRPVGGTLLRVVNVEGVLGRGLVAGPFFRGSQLSTFVGCFNYGLFVLEPSKLFGGINRR